MSDVDLDELERLAQESGVRPAFLQTAVPALVAEVRRLRAGSLPRRAHETPLEYIVEMRTKHRRHNAETHEQIQNLLAARDEARAKIVALMITIEEQAQDLRQQAQKRAAMHAAGDAMAKAIYESNNAWPDLLAAWREASR